MADLPNDRGGLEAREALVDESEIDLSFQEAQLRGRERLIGAQREALTQRAGWLDERERRLLRSQDGAPTRAPPLTGLGEGRALQDADVEGYVARSATLHLGRVAMLAAREEMLMRRKALLRARREELEAYEEAFTRAEVRLGARERLVAQTTVQLQRSIAAEAAKSADAFAAEARQTLANTGAVLPPTAHRDPPPPTPAPLKSSAKRMTSTPIIRPVTQAASEPAAPLLPRPLPVAALPTVPDPVQPPQRVRPASPTPPPSPRTRVLVDSDAANVERHADTMAMDQEEHASADAELLTVSRPRDLDVHSAGLPPDLPDAPPDLPRPFRGQTISLLGSMSLEDQPLTRSQIEFDPTGRTILISFEGAEPQLPKRTEMVWRERDGQRRQFAVQVRRVINAPPRGHAVVLAPIDWAPADFDVLATILARMA